MATNRKITATLFWVTTSDHAEDWFILARSRPSACHFHEAYEGYERGDATARKVIVGVELTNGEDLPRHAQIEDLKPLGFRIVQESPYRIVRYGGKTYSEGQLQALIDVLEALQEKNEQETGANGNQ